MAARFTDGPMTFGSNINPLIDRACSGITFTNLREVAAVYDIIDNAITVQMARGDGPVYGYIQVPCRVELNPHPPAGAEAQIV